MEELNAFGLFADLLGSSREANVSKDGKAINICGEIADGIREIISIRPSNSTPSGFAVDVNIDGSTLKHIEGKPKL